jgi:hypothetical protein
VATVAVIDTRLSHETSEGRCLLVAFPNTIYCRFERRFLTEFSGSCHFAACLAAGCLLTLTVAEYVSIGLKCLQAHQKFTKRMQKTLGHVEAEVRLTPIRSVASATRKTRPPTGRIGAASTTAELRTTGRLSPRRGQTTAQCLASRKRRNADEHRYRWHDGGKKYTPADTQHADGVREAERGEDAMHRAL